MADLVETAHLSLDFLGVVWLEWYEYEGPAAPAELPIRLTALDAGAWPARLGPEPEWFDAELAEIRRVLEEGCTERSLRVQEPTASVGDPRYWRG